MNKVQVTLEHSSDAISRRYKITKLKGALLVSVRAEKSNAQLQFRVGESLTENQAQELVTDSRHFDVTVIPA